MNETLKKHLKIISYLLGSGLCAVALIHLTNLPQEYSLFLSGTINYIAYALEKELRNEGFIRNETKN